LLKSALRVGLPVGLQLGAETGIFALAGLLAGRLGAIELAAHQVALSLASFTFCFALGIGNAAAVRVGWSVGARDHRAVRRRGFCALGAGAALMSLSGLAFLLIPRQVASLLSNRPEVLTATVPLLAVAAFFQIADGIQAVGAGVLRGLGDTRFAFLANLVGHYAIGLPIALICGFLLERGVLGIWWGLSAGLFSVAAALLARFARIAGRSFDTIDMSGIAAAE
jgi:MATE family multidrug resistance protein